MSGHTKISYCLICDDMCLHKYTIIYAYIYNTYTNIYDMHMYIFFTVHTSTYMCVCVRATSYPIIHVYSHKVVGVLLLVV